VIRTRNKELRVDLNGGSKFESRQNWRAKFAMQEGAKGAFPFPLGQRFLSQPLHLQRRTSFAAVCHRVENEGGDEGMREERAILLTQNRNTSVHVRSFIYPPRINYSAPLSEPNPNSRRFKRKGRGGGERMNTSPGASSQR